MIDTAALSSWAGTIVLSTGACMVGAREVLRARGRPPLRPLDAAAAVLLVMSIALAAWRVWEFSAGLYRG